MRTILLAVAAAAMIANSAAAATFDRSRLAGAQIHRNATFAHATRWETWVLHRDGRLTGTWHSERDASGATVEQFGQIVGRWSVSNGQLCITGTGFAQPGRRCFALIRGGHSARQYRMTDAGISWDVFIYPRAGISSAERR